MYRRDVAIDSKCRECGRAVHIETQGQGHSIKVSSPVDAVVWSGIMETNGRAADTLCTVIAFFCREDHLNAYRAATYPTVQGYTLSLDEAMQAGRPIFTPLYAGDGPT